MERQNITNEKVGFKKPLNIFEAIQGKMQFDEPEMEEFTNEEEFKEEKKEEPKPGKFRSEFLFPIKFLF